MKRPLPSSQGNGAFPFSLSVPCENDFYGFCLALSEVAKAKLLGILDLLSFKG